MTNFNWHLFKKSKNAVIESSSNYETVENPSEKEIENVEMSKKVKIHSQRK